MKLQRSSQFYRLKHFLSMLPLWYVCMVYKLSKVNRVERSLKSFQLGLFLRV